MRVILLALMVAISLSCKRKQAIIDKDWVTVSSGECNVGGPGHAINPQRQIHFKGFTIARFEVTNQEFAKFVKETGYITLAEKHHNALVFHDSMGEFLWYTDTTAYWQFPNGKKFGGIDKSMNHPVTCISMIDALAFCKWKNVRLPTLDEWEVACRAGTDGRWFFANNQDSIKDYANIWHKENHLAPDSSEPWLFTSPVGSKKPNPWGVYDTYGNVFELCADKPLAFSKDKTIVCARGGSWWCSRYSCNYTNSVDIGKVNPYSSFSNLGFRVVKIQ